MGFRGLPLKITAGCIEMDKTVRGVGREKRPNEEYWGTPATKEQPERWCLWKPSSKDSLEVSTVKSYVGMSTDQASVSSWVKVRIES